MLEKTLLESRGNRALTARRLGISRARLLRRLAQLNIVASETELATDPDLEPELMDHSNSTKEDVTMRTSKSTTAAHEPESPKTSIASDDFTAIDFVPVDDETTP